jgi:hypothetical protein
MKKTRSKKSRDTVPLRIRVMTKMTFSLFANKAQFRPFWQKNSKVAIFVMYFIQHCFIFRPPGSTVSHDAEIAPRTAATLAFRKCHDNFFRKNFRVAKMFTIIVQPSQKSLNSFCFFTKIFMNDIKSFTKASKL